MRFAASFDAKEAKPKYECGSKRQPRPDLTSRARCNDSKSARKAARQKKKSFNKNELTVKELCAARATCGGRMKHCVGSEERSK
jgi:hypothetical protein